MAQCRYRRLTALTLMVSGLLGGAQAYAQDFRVYTTVRDVNIAAPANSVVGRSLTLFHAGKVYDYMDGPGELVIYEPIHDRFVLIHGYMGSIVPMSELRQLNELARTEGARLEDELANSSAPQDANRLKMLSFQLNPQFQESWDTDDRQLTLSGAEFNYIVRTETASSRDNLELYLTYADWAAQLNSVLHSQAMYPDARLKLNEVLRGRQRLPVTVVLKGRNPAKMHLQAEHEFGAQLQAIDRNLIHQWERTRESERMQWVTFREYQQRLTQGETNPR
ncbi:MAG: hypothetical protein R3C01_03730 [Planctomycetaceae bacterium]